MAEKNRGEICRHVIIRLTAASVSGNSYNNTGITYTVPDWTAVNARLTVKDAPPCWVQLGQAALCSIEGHEVLPVCLIDQLKSVRILSVLHPPASPACDIVDLS